MKIARAFAVLFVAVACAGSPLQPPPASANIRLYEATSHEIAVIDATTHLAIRHLPLGVPAADWQHLYSISGTALVDTDPASGLTSTTLQLPGPYQLPAATSSGLPGGISPNGYWLVAQAYDGAATRFVIVSTAEMRIVHAANLSGRFTFDAISDDGMRLYLIQYLNGREYYVRLFNVLTDTLDANIVVDKSDGQQSMTGLRLSGIATPGGTWLFSMYVRESDNPFLHVLSLDGPFAFCLDLPGSGYTSSHAEKHWSIAMDRTGDSLYAINAATGVLAQVDNSQQFNPQIKRTGHIAGGTAADVGSNAAVLSPDGRWLIAAGSSGVLWIDTTTLTVRTQALPGWHVWSLGPSPDGSEVYAVSDSGQVAELETETGRVISTFDTSVGRPMELMRVASA